MKQISKYVSWKEIISNRKNNIPNDQQLSNIKDLIFNVLEPIREHIGGPLGFWSIFRSEVINKAINGAKRSQHMANSGAAADLDAQIYKISTNLDIAAFIITSLEWDQLILEFPDETGEPEWIHVSYNKGKNRKQILLAISSKDGTKYIDITNDIV